MVENLATFIFKAEKLFTIAKCLESCVGPAEKLDKSFYILLDEIKDLEVSYTNLEEPLHDLI